MITGDIDIETMLLPVSVKEMIASNGKDPPKLTKHVFITSASGEFISSDIPLKWAKYIADKLNSKKLPARISDKKLLAKIVVQGKVPSEMQARAITQDRSGMIKIKRSDDMSRFVKRFDKQFAYWVKTKHNVFPIQQNCHVIALFHVNIQEVCTLAEFLLPLETAFYEVGILDSRYKMLIKSWDGSKIVHCENEPHVDIVIREY